MAFVSHTLENRRWDFQPRQAAYLKHRWVDADSMVLNPALSPCVFLPPERLENIYALVTADHNGLNNGVFYLKVHTSSIDLLTRIIDYPLSYPEDDLGWFGEQAAMAKVIESIETAHQDPFEPSGIVWLPRSWINNYEWEHGFEGTPGSFMVHFAGLGETRLAHMAAWLVELQQNQVKWEIPFGNTSLKDAIPEFWRGYIANTTGSL
jgi:hypothetical protein